MQSKILVGGKLINFFEKKIKHEVERSKKQGLPIRELTWEKQFGRAFKSNSKNLNSKNITSLDPMNQVFKMLINSGEIAIRRMPKGSNVVSRIHTHPGGSGFISIQDMRSFLVAVSKNKHLRFEVVVAHDNFGKVVGCSIAHYRGRPSDALKVLESFNKDYFLLESMRLREIKEHPERFKHMTIGDSLLEVTEKIEFCKNFFAQHDMGIKYFPINGRHYNPTTGYYEYIDFK